MSNIIVEGFATYGLGDASTAIENAMQAGAWAQAAFGNGNAGLGTLPWDPANTDIYCFNTANGPIRRVLPATTDTVIVSMYYAVDNLPDGNDRGYIIRFSDESNTTIAYIVTQSTGAIQLKNNNGTLLATTQGPVLVAETATHLEMKITVSTGTFQLKVNETSVISGRGYAFTGTTHVAQFAIIGGPNSIIDINSQYCANLIVRDTAGSANNDFMGDRRVATLLVNSDDLSHQGWTGQPRKRFGNGILDITTGTSGVRCASTTDTNLGNGDFTIEGQFRFQTLPTGSNKAQFFGKWDEANNRRSYQWYLGGPSLESGLMVFRISTDGLAGTVTEKLTWPWAPDTDTWYHLALCRSAGELLLFINGVQQGLPIADASTYFVGTATSALGVQDNSGSAVANTNFDGWMDEFRLTVGVSRYSSDFTPPTGPFPRGSGADPDWTDVAWLSGFDSGIFDESSHGRTLTAIGSAAMLTPNDGVFNYQTMNKLTPFDDTFIEAALIPATGILTQTVQPANGKTVTVGTTDGSTAAVYTWRTAISTAFDVLIDTTLTLSLANLCSAINAGSGSGTKYGTGTTANFDVTAEQLPIEQIEVTATTPGTGGNAIACSTNDSNGSWADTHLDGGVDIPGYSQFGLQRPPNEVTIIDSITVVHRGFKTDSGFAQDQQSFVGPGGTSSDGATNTLTTVPTLYFDTFEEDPDTGGDLTPTTVINGKVRINRTA